MSIMINGKVVAGGGVKAYDADTYFRAGSIAYKNTGTEVEWYKALTNSKGAALTSSSWERVHDVKVLQYWLNEGEILTDPEGWSEVNKYAHSTFDSSKFTVVGSPTITSDGIASGFSGSNYLTINGATLTNSNEWEVVTPVYKISSVSQQDNGFNYYTGSGTTLNRLVVTFKSDGGLVILIGADNYAEIIRDTTLTYTINDTFKFKFKHTKNNVYSVYYQKNNSNWTLLASVTNTVSFSVTSVNIGSIFSGSIDLKQFSIAVDGVEVFSGNKTGIDTIKADDYTVVGSPTISTDGVAGGFSSSNYLTTNLTFTPKTKIEVWFKYTTGNDINTNQWAYRFSNDLLGSEQTIGVGIYGGKFKISLKSNVSYNWIDCSVNTTYIIKTVFTSSSTITEIYSKDGTLIDSYTYTTAPILMQGNNSQLTIGASTGSLPFLGSIDLNAFKIFVDGDLIYQPCLKIPYTESSERYNCKVVDDIYRDKVVDCYEQGYKNTYYTLGDSDYTLPMGNIFEVNKIQEITEESNTIEYPSAKAVQDKLHPLKGYADKGEILTDPEGLQDVISYAHSTFDVSKFTKINSPIVTTNGIASGFSDSNYLITPDLSFGSSAWEITGSFVFNTSTYNQALVSGMTQASAPLLYVNAAGMQLNIPSTSGTWGWQLQNAPHTFTVGNTYYYKIGWDGVNYYIKISDDNQTWTTLQTLSGTAMFSGSGTFKLAIGANPTNASRYVTGSIDLKQFSITVDGVEVFSGNRTGIDTIKSDDYTVVGTPTISAEGIASGFSESNYFTQTLDFRNATSWKVCIPFKTPNSISSTVRVFQRAAATSSYIGVGINTSGIISFMTIAGNNYTASNVSFQANTSYLFEFAYENSTYIIKYKKDGDADYTTILNQLSSSVWDASVLHYIGNGSNTNEFFTGSIDLNAFKIYVDGDLIYQPCLKIPFTESKTGSKIADMIYLDRVEDAYNQGYLDYSYYTLDEDNGNFTLPQGELYGNIERLRLSNQITKSVPTTTPTASYSTPAVVIYNYKSGSDKCIVFSDGTCIMSGAFEINVSTYSFPILQADNTTSVAIIQSGTASAIVGRIALVSVTTTGFEISGIDGNVVPATWIAMGTADLTQLEV